MTTKALISSTPTALIEIGCSVGFDGSSGLPTTHPGYRFISDCRSAGVRSYIETWPDKSAAHWADANVIIASNVWYSHWFTVTDHPMPRAKMTGEIKGTIVVDSRLGLVVNADQETNMTIEDGGKSSAIKMVTKIKGQAK